MLTIRQVAKSSFVTSTCATLSDLLDCSATYYLRGSIHAHWTHHDEQIGANLASLKVGLRLTDTEGHFLAWAYSLRKEIGNTYDKVQRLPRFAKGDPWTDFEVLLNSSGYPSPPASELRNAVRLHGLGLLSLNTFDVVPSLWAFLTATDTLVQLLETSWLCESELMERLSAPCPLWLSEIKDVLSSEDYLEMYPSAVAQAHERAAHGMPLNGLDVAAFIGWFSLIDVDPRIFETLAGRTHQQAVERAVREAFIRASRAQCDVTAEDLISSMLTLAN